ncbi:MAG: molybdopterin molybdotransferase MoeA [Bacteroidales bacterium]|nr:molybdopterin molybdotransferase MoeA [Bacteroidales bacterium]
MIQLEKAIELALKNASILGIEPINFRQSLNRILAEDITSDIDIPPFNKSAMDGYALRREDANLPLTIVQTVQAGSSPIAQLKHGECVKIMTGARIPDNADYVAKIEDTSLNQEGKVIIKNIENKPNIRFASEDVKNGEVVLHKGTLIRPQEIATLATIGKTTIKVFQKPKISISSTGSELIEPENTPNDVQIRNSNAYQLIAQCNKIGLETTYNGIIADDIDQTIFHIKKMLKQSDILIFSGGVSMGDFDFIPQALQQLNFNIIFHTIAVQPGKPTLMARKGNQYCFGLPGNPVSSFMQFELIVKPFIYKIMGHSYHPQTAFLPLAHEYRRKKAERTSLIPVRIEDNKVYPVEYHGSAHLFALNSAHGFIIIPQHTTIVPTDTYVTVRFI